MLNKVKFVVAAAGSSYCGLGNMDFYGADGEKLAVRITQSENLEARGEIDVDGKTVGFTVRASNCYSNNGYYWCGLPISQSGAQYDYWMLSMTGSGCIGHWWEMEFDEGVNVAKMTVGRGSSNISPANKYLFDVFINDNPSPVMTGMNIGENSAPTEVVLEHLAVVALKDGVYYCAVEEVSE